MTRSAEILVALLALSTIIGLVLAARFMPLPFPYDLRRPYFMAAAFGLGVLLSTAGILLWARGVHRETLRRLDAVLPGFTSSAMGWGGQKYDRQVAGRGVQ